MSLVAGWGLLLTVSQTLTGFAQEWKSKLIKSWVNWANQTVILTPSQQWDRIGRKGPIPTSALQHGVPRRPFTPGSRPEEFTPHLEATRCQNAAHRRDSAGPRPARCDVAAAGGTKPAITSSQGSGERRESRKSPPPPKPVFELRTLGPPDGRSGGSPDPIRSGPGGAGPAAAWRLRLNPLESQASAQARSPPRSSAPRSAAIRRRRG